MCLFEKATLVDMHYFMHEYKELNAKFGKAHIVTLSISLRHDDFDVFWTENSVLYDKRINNLIYTSKHSF